MYRLKYFIIVLQLGWAWGDPHFTTIDGHTYTFNGLGEYVLLRIDSINFQMQGRTSKLMNESDATFFTAIAIGTTNTDNIIQVRKFKEIVKLLASCTFSL